MTETEVVAPTIATVRAADMALAWLNAFIASGDDENHPVLNRTLCIEAFDAGLQLIGCNGSALFRTWVRKTEENADGISTDWPDVNEQPVRSFVVMDPDAFGVTFMRALLAATNEDGRSLEELHLAVEQQDEGATLALGAAFTSERVVLRSCGQRLDLRLYEAPYPNWRKAEMGVDESERVDGLTIGHTMFKLIGRLKGITALDVEFTGENTRIGFRAWGSAYVRGLVMPMRREGKKLSD